MYLITAIACLVICFLIIRAIIRLNYLSPLLTERKSLVSAVRTLAGIICIVAAIIGMLTKNMTMQSYNIFIPISVYSVMQSYNVFISISIYSIVIYISQLCGLKYIGIKLNYKQHILNILLAVMLSVALHFFNITITTAPRKLGSWIFRSSFSSFGIISLLYITSMEYICT